MNKGDRSPSSLSELLHHLIELGDNEKVSLAEVMESLDDRSYGPMLLLPAALAASPLGGIPGMSLITGALIIVLSAQLLFLKSSPWLPSWLLKMSLPRAKTRRAIEKVLPWVRWFETPVKQRWIMLTRPPFTQFIACVCITLALLFYPLALFPFVVAIPATAVCFFALGLTSKDGVLILIGILISLAAASTFMLYGS